jgi:hypothetical protein
MPESLTPKNTNGPQPEHPVTESLSGIHTAFLLVNGAVSAFSLTAQAIFFA